MLPSSHIYVATKVAKKKSPLLVFGSVLPDVSWTSQSEIGRDQIHYAPKKLYKYLSKNYSSLLDLGVGVRLHSNIDKGADYYSDGENYSGFAYIEGAKIESEVAKLLGGKKDMKSKVLSHNFIEAGTDLNLLSDKPEVLKLYSESINKIDLNQISACLGDYLSLDSKIVRKELERFLQFIGPSSYTSESSIVEKMVLLIKTRKGSQVDSKGVATILGKAKTIMKGKYKSYLEEAITEMTVDFSDLLS